MVLQPRERRWTPCLVLLAGLLTLTVASGPLVQAAEPDKTQTSLQRVPADAAFYAAMLRNREQVDAIVKSNAWARLMDMTSVKQGLKLLEAQYKSGQAATFRQLLEAPENQELLAVLGEAVSDEIFCYGTESWANLFDLTAEVFGQLVVAQRSGNLQDPRQAGKAIFQALADHTDQLKFPDLVIGFKMANPEKAKNQLKRLEQLAEAFGQQGPLQGRIKRSAIGGGSFLVVSLDGSLVPWDQIPLKDFEEKEGQSDKLIKTLSEMKLVISLGVQGNYLLLSVGSSTDPIAKFAGKGNKLGDRPELKPLAKFADKRLTSIDYVSKAMRSRTATTPKDLDGIVDTVTNLLKMSDLDESQQKKLLKDVGEIVNDMKKLLPEPGAALAFSFLTETGMETYDYNYGKFPALGKPRTLTLLDHLGGKPLLGVVSVGSSVSSYQMLSKWVKLIHANADEILLPRLDGDAKDKYQQVSKALLPLARRFDEITSKMLVPSLDGQSGFVLDGKWTSNQWHRFMEKTEKELPLPEFGVLLGLNDPVLFQKAMTEYRKLMDDTIGVARELVPQANIPDIKIPEPETAKKEDGTLFYYPIPDLVGLDPRIVPTAGIGPKLMVFAFSHEHAERLLARRPLQIKDVSMPDAKRPLLGAVVFNWAGLVETVTPWVELVANQAIKRHVGDNAEQAAEVRKEVKTVLEVLKCYRGSVSATYLEGGAMVTHAVSVVKDLAK